MGNYVSCNYSCACINASYSQRAKFETTVLRKRSLAEKTIMVVHSVEERVVEMAGGSPMKVAELMLEFPGHFVVGCETDISSSSPSTTINFDVTRATPLPADNEASPGHIYILFPMHRLHTRISPHENASLKSLLSSHIAHSHLQQLLPAACSRKKSLHSLMIMQASSSAKVTPLSSLHLDEEALARLSASANDADGQHDDTDAQVDDEIDLLLQQFCCASSTVGVNNGGAFMSKSGSLVRSKSWIPKLETINESCILVV